MNEINEEIRLGRYFAAIWRAKWLILIGILAAAAITALVAFRQPTLYTATALVKVGRVWKEQLEDPYLTAERAGSAGFLQTVSEKIGLKPNQLKRSIQSKPIVAGPRRAARYPILVSITATTDSSDESIRRAGAVANELISEHERIYNEALAPHLERQRQIEEHLKDPALQSPDARELRIRLEDELAKYRANNSSPNITERTALTDPVIVPGDTIKPPVWRNVAAASLIAALTGIAAAGLAGYFTPEQNRRAASNSQ